MRIFLLLCLGTLACARAPAEPQTVDTVQIEGRWLVRPGIEDWVHARTFDATGAELVDQPVSWSSSDTAVVTVSPGDPSAYGRISTFSSGVAEITAVSGAAAARLSVTVPRDTYVAGDYALFAVTIPDGWTDWPRCGVDSGGVTCQGLRLRIDGLGGLEATHTLESGGGASFSVMSKQVGTYGLIDPCNVTLQGLSEPVGAAAVVFVPSFGGFGVGGPGSNWLVVRDSAAAITWMFRRQGPDVSAC